MESFLSSRIDENGEDHNDQRYDNQRHGPRGGAASVLR